MKLYNCIYFLLSRAQQTAVQEYKAQLEAYDLTPSQFTVLKCLWELGSLSPGQLAEATYIERPAITGILDRLESRGMVRRVPDYYDRRSINICLTEEAAELKDRIIAAAETANNNVLAGFDEKERATVLNALHEISCIPDI